MGKVGDEDCEWGRIPVLVLQRGITLGPLGIRKDPRNNKKGLCIGIHKGSEKRSVCPHVDIRRGFVKMAVQGKLPNHS